MNRMHQCACASRFWSRYAGQVLVPWVVDSCDVGADVLELGPGYGATTRVLARRFPNLTALELDARLAGGLRERVQHVRVIHGDGAAMPFDDCSYSTAVCFTMLHHVPSAALQDRTFAEVYRVLRPGGVFAGTDGRSNVLFRLIHMSDTFVPVNPQTLSGRLNAVGFEQVSVDTRMTSFRFCARKPLEASPVWPRHGGQVDDAN